IATIDYEARIDHRVVGRGDGRLVEVGGEPTAGPGAHLEGAEIGTPVTFEVDYPADHDNRDLAGKRVAFRVVVSALARRELPALDDAFAKSVADCESVDALRQRVREQLIAAVRRDADKIVRGELVARLVGAHELEVPQAMVERRVNALIEE